MLKSFLHFIEDAGLSLDKSQTVLLAVSGGADSVCLARLMQQAGFKAAIAHVNYGLRGKESDEDADFVANLADELGFTFHLLRAVVRAEDKKRFGLQAVARKIRYDWFGQLCSRFGYNTLATAHQADDVYETYLLYEKQGRHNAALNALPLQRPLRHSDPASPMLIRPLRFARRMEIRTWLQDEGYAWREDSTNNQTVYTRNRLRLELEQSTLYADQLDAIGEQQLSHLQRIRAWEAFTLVCTYREYGETVIRSETVYHEPDGSAWLQWFLRSHGFNAAQCSQLWKNGRNAGKSHRGQSGWQIETARGHWYLFNKLQEEWPARALRPGATAIALPFCKLRLESGEKDAYPFTLANMAFQLNDLEPVLELRPFRKGETIFVERAGHRKISDILSEAGVPRHRRHVWPVLEYKGQIIAIPLIKRSGLYPVTGEDSLVIWLNADRL